MMNGNRDPVKNKHENTRLRWQSKIKSEYMDHMKKKRQLAMSHGREERWFEKNIQHELDKFKSANELAMRREGIHDIDTLIEESMRQGENEYEMYIKLEQAELEEAVSSYEETVWCLNCVNGRLIPQDLGLVMLLRCELCGFYTTLNTLGCMQQHEQEHTRSCQHRITYSAEPGNDRSIMGICEACDDWTIYNL